MIDWSICVFDTVGSTNDIAREAAQSGVAEGAVYHAYHQTAGRGRRANVWVSVGGNLYMSLVLRPHCSIAKAGEISFIMAVALARVIQGYGLSPALKWPNDVLLGGRKVSGILLESGTDETGKLAYLIAGIGVNVVDCPDEASALAPHVPHAGLNADIVRDDFLAAFAPLYDSWKTSGFSPIRTEWLKFATGMEKPLIVRLPNAEKQGIFSGLTDDGALLLQLPDGGYEHIYSGDVFFPPPKASKDG